MYRFFGIVCLDLQTFWALPVVDQQFNDVDFCMVIFIGFTAFSRVVGCLAFVDMVGLTLRSLLNF
jgi:hypothetical protein